MKILAQDLRKGDVLISPFGDYLIAYVAPERGEPGDTYTYAQSKDGESLFLMPYEEVTLRSRAP